MLVSKWPNGIQSRNNLKKIKVKSLIIHFYSTPPRSIRVQTNDVIKLLETEIQKF